MQAKVRINNRQKKEPLTRQARDLIRQACKATLKCEGFSDDCEIDVTVVDDEQIREMNLEFRNIDKSTDVLSFPLGENGEYDINPETNAFMLGDVVLSLEHALFQAELFGHGTERELAYLTVHSVLHLLGYDHVNNEEERKAMRSREEKVLALLNLGIIGEK